MIETGEQHPPGDNHAGDRKMERLRQQQADGTGDPERIVRAFQAAQLVMDNAMDDIQQSGRLHTRTTKFMTNPNRCLLAKSCTPTPSASRATSLTGSPSTEPSSTSTRTFPTGLIARGTRFTLARFPSRSSIQCCVLITLSHRRKINEQAYRDLMYPNGTFRIDQLNELLDELSRSGPTRRVTH